MFTLIVRFFFFVSLILGLVACDMAPQADCDRSTDDSGLGPSPTPAASPTPGQTPPAAGNACSAEIITASTDACINGGGTIDDFSCDPIYGVKFDCDTSCVDSSGCTAEQITAANETCSATWVTSMVCSGGNVAVTCGSTGGDGSNPTPIPGATECSDEIDNDGDDLIDYPSDPGCSSVDDDNETDEDGGESADRLGTLYCDHPYDSATAAWISANGKPTGVVLQDINNDSLPDKFWVASQLYWWELGILDLDNDGDVDDENWSCSSNTNGDPDDQDNDGDGFSEEDGDADDNDPGNKPTAVDVCGDGMNNNCVMDSDGVCIDGLDEECETDEDGDDQTELSSSPDCNDDEGTIYTDAYEYGTDGVDNNCTCSNDSDGDGKYCDAGDQQVDEPNCLVDGDGDGYVQDEDCDGVSGEPGEDCNDSTTAISPAATDYGGDGNDNDCDGTDE